MVAVLRFLFVIPFAFVVACYGAAFALLWPFLSAPQAALSDPFEAIRLAVLFTAQAAQVGSVVLVPWALAMVVSEAMGWSSLILHAAIGLAGGFTISRIAYGDVAASHAIQAAIMVAGLAFALIYWIIAGRGAGRWRERPQPPQQQGETR